MYARLLVRLSGDGGERGGRSVHGEQVVHPGPGQQLAVPAQVGGRLDGVRHQVPAGHVLGVDARLLGDEPDQVALLDVPEPPDRLHVLLPVELETVGVGRPVQVHGQLRYAQQRPVDVHQPVRAVAQRDPARETEVPVEPGVEERAAVDLHGDLPPAVRPGVGQRLDPQVRRVGVRTDDPERGVRRGALRHVPGHDRTAAQDILPAAGPVPGRSLLDLPESGLLQPGGRGGHGVVRGRGGHQEGHQIVGVPAVEAEGGTHVPHCNETGPDAFTTVVPVRALSSTAVPPRASRRSGPAAPARRTWPRTP